MSFYSFTRVRRGFFVHARGNPNAETLELRMWRYKPHELAPSPLRVVTVYCGLRSEAESHVGPAVDKLMTDVLNRAA